MLEGMLGMVDSHGPDQDAEKYERRVGPMEVTMRKMARDPKTRSTGMAIYILDQAPDWDRFVQMWERATRQIPRLRQRIVDPPLGIGTPLWLTDANFDLRYHVRRVRVAAPGDMRQLLDLAAPIMMSPTDQSRALWEVLLVEGLNDGRAAVIQRGDHMTDGAGGMKMLEVMCDLERNPPAQPMPSAPRPEDPSAVFRDDITDRLREAPRSVWRAVSHGAASAASTARHPRRSARDAADMVSSVRRSVDDLRVPRSPLLRGRSLSFHFELIEVTVEDFKRAGRTVGGSLNDAFLAGVSGGMRLYHEHHGMTMDRMPVGCTVSVRKADDVMLSNKMAGLVIPAPTGTADPKARMTKIRGEVLSRREDPLLTSGEAISGVMAYLPVEVLKLVSAVGPDVNTSNLPGPTVPLYMAGGRIERTFGFAPLAGTAMILGLTSINGVCCIGVNIDPAAVADPGVLIDCLRRGFEEVLDVAGEHTPVTTPGSVSPEAPAATPAPAAPLRATTSASAKQKEN